MLHGAYGSPTENWFPWLKSQLEAESFKVLLPQFPTPEGQSLASWMDVFAPYLPELDGDSILIGHSLGAAFILRILEQLERPVRASLLAAGFTKLLGIPKFDTINASFLESPFDWQKIRANAGACTVFHGENDPYVPLAFGQELAKNLGADLVVIPGGGHLNAGAGYEEFPALLSAIEG